MFKHMIYISIIVFLLYSNISPLETQSPDNILPYFLDAPKERPSPYDRIKESQLRVTDHDVSIVIPDAKLARFTDTNSMDPLIDSESTAIQITPKTEKEIHIGDIISFSPENSDKIMIHRIINISEDSQGTYYTTKGDNMKYPDPIKIRFSQIERVLVGILY